MVGVTLNEELKTRRICPWPHMGAPRYIANTVVHLVRDAPWTTGAVIAVDGGTTCD